MCMKNSRITENKDKETTRKNRIVEKPLRIPKFSN